MARKLLCPVWIIEATMPHKCVCTDILMGDGEHIEFRILPKQVAISNATFLAQMLTNNNSS
jgi:hypothetical protein